MLSRTSLVRTASVGALSLLAAALSVVGPATPAVAATPLEVTFTSTTPQTWTVPDGVTSVTVTAVGGRGGDKIIQSANPQQVIPGGRGALVEGTLTVTPRQQIRVRVAGNGGDAPQFHDGITPAAGANGGQPGTVAYFSGSGGASDIRIGGDTYQHRMLVAGGGAGSGGGDAGQPGTQVNPFWGCSLSPAQPGSQSAGGAGATATNCDSGVVIPPGAAGTIGVGGVGGGEFTTPTNRWAGSSAGGGGYYGGGGGAIGNGAGGSSYLAPAFTARHLGLAPADSTPYITFSYLSAVRDIVIEPIPSVPADGTSRTIVNISLRDANGPTNAHPPTVTISAGTVLGTPTALGLGYYHVFVQAPNAPTTATVTVSAGGHSHTRTVDFTTRLQSLSTAPPPSGTTYVGDAWTPGASSTSTLPVDITTQGPCAFSGDDVRFTGAGECTLTLDQGGNELWAPASDAVTITVVRRPQTITFPAPAPARVGETTTLTATGANSDLPVTFSTTGPGCTLDGTTLTLVSTGACQITAAQAGDAEHEPATTSLDYTAGKALQTITFAPAPTGFVGDSVTLTANGGASGEPITYAVAHPEICVPTGDELTFTGAGDCVITASQAGTVDHEAAADVTATVAVSRVATTLALESPASITYGEDLTLTANVPGAVPGQVVFSINGAKHRVTAAAGLASVTVASLPAGVHAVTAVFNPTDEVTYLPSAAAPVSASVAKAATASTVAVTPTQVTASVTSEQSGTGFPTGEVTFSVDGTVVGTATLVGGVATLSHIVDTSADRAVSMEYAGSDNFLPSVASTARKNPTITSALSSRPNAKGWHGKSVTVSFTCTPGSGELNAACPKPVKVTDTRGRTITRTVHAVDGGIATASVVDLRVDTVAPKVRIQGVREGRTYSTAPRATCMATDTRSGVAKCTVRHKVRADRITWTARAVDHAGNKSRVAKTARLTRIELLGAPRRNGVHVVRAGAEHVYTLVVHGKQAPTYLTATQAPRQPWVKGMRFRKVGPNRWALGVRFEPTMRHTARWNIGAQVGNEKLVLKVRVLIS